MDALYNELCAQCSKNTTLKYSTSFSLGIKMFDKKYRAPIYSIYGMVRFADEIVDTFYDIDQESFLNKFEKDTFEAINLGFSLNPILHTFQSVVNQYNIDHELVYAFFKSMRMDLDQTIYNRQLYDEYIYGSAEVIGLMCLCVFVNGDMVKYNELTVYAKALGSAFQKINFLRDLKSDFKDRGRVYFPGVDLSNFTDESKIKIQEEIQKEFDLALIGIKKLPKGVRLGVHTAYTYYTKLFKKIKSSPKEKLLSARIRIADPIKILLLANTLITRKLFFSK